MLRLQDRAAVLRTHPSELSPPTQPDGRDSYEKANEMIAIAFERGSHRFEWMHQRADNEVFPVEVLLTAVEEPGRRVLHVVWRDITERKQLEDRLRHAQKMEAVGKLAGGIAHDFNNLLVVIRGHAELLERSTRATHELDEHIHAILEAGDRAAALVKQLLAFGRKQQRLPQVLDLNEIVARLKGMLGRLIGEDLVLETRLASSPLPTEVDASQIEQVIMNLVSNARDASPEGGSLRIRTAAVEVAASDGDSDTASSLPPGPYALLTVADDGVGMPPSVLEHAFDPFFTTKGPDRGTGLGLSTVYAIVQQSRGAIRIESKEGAGTTVSVHLPLSGGRVARSLPRRMESGEIAPPSRGECILVVEDDDAVRQLILHALAGQGYELLEAGDGLEGVERFLAHADRIELVVSDIIMPRAGGPRMAKLLAQKGHRPRLLFLSGYTDDALSELHLAGSNVDLLEKPFSTASLAARVRAALDRPRPDADQG